MTDTGTTSTEPTTADGLRQLRILIDEGCSGYTRHTVASLLAERDRKVRALNEATALNGAHERTIARLREQLQQAQSAPGPAGLTRVWSGYDDDECWLPMFAELTDAKAYAEQAYRAQCAALGNEDPGEVTWRERQARTEDRGYPGMYDLDSQAHGRDGWVVCELLVHSTLASGLTERPIETDEEPAEPEPQVPGQQEVPVGVSAR